MMQNNPNPLGLIQNLLTQLSNHIYQINEIIVQMNDVMNQMNSPNFNQMNSPNFNQMNNLMEQMNGFNNFSNNINFNPNIPSFNQPQNLDITNNNYKDLIYIKFNKSNGASTALNIDKNNTIAQLINIYLEKFGFNENQAKFVFLYNGSDLEDMKEKKIEEILNNGSQITVFETKTFL